MREDSFLIHLWKLIAVAAAVCCLMIHISDLTRVITITLVLLCIFTAQFILDQHSWKIRKYSKHKYILIKRVNDIVSACCLFYLMFFETMDYSPIVIVLIYQMIQSVQEAKLFFGITFASVCIYQFIFVRDVNLLILTSIFSIAIWISFYLVRKLMLYKEKTEEARMEIQTLTMKLKDNERLMKTIRYAAALEERNRMSARLHDKIGHNISGSILMLEASMLQMEKDPQKAVQEVNRAVEHLRNGVDDLRHALRQERPVRSDISSNEIMLLLDQARTEHNLNTFLKTEGDLEQITSEVWQCIHDNVTEVLTNVYKHSKASAFTVHIKVMPSMVRVTYTDNGACETEFKKGLGLEALEDRTVRCLGRCFFEASELGFKVTNVFMISKAGRGVS